MRPTAPSSSCSVTSTTVRRKFGSSRSAPATRSLPLSESCTRVSSPTPRAGNAEALNPGRSLARSEVEVLECLGRAPVHRGGAVGVLAPRGRLALREPDGGALADPCALEGAVRLRESGLGLVDPSLPEQRAAEHELRVAELEAVVEAAADEDERAVREPL